MRSASHTTLAPPSMRELITMAWLEASHFSARHEERFPASDSARRLVFGFEFRLEELPELDHFNFFATRAEAPGGSAGILHGPQMPDHADPKLVLDGSVAHTRRGALHHDVHLLAGGQLLGRFRLQHDQPIGKLERFARFRTSGECRGRRPCR